MTQTDYDSDTDHIHASDDSQWVDWVQDLATDQQDAPWTWDSQPASDIQALKLELEKMTDIAKMAQSNYLRTKMEFDQYQTRTSLQADDHKLQTIFAIVQNIAPVIDQMKLSLDHIPQDSAHNDFVTGIQLVYQNLLKVLESYKIFPLSAVWMELDPELHEPVGTTDTDDTLLKGKIVQELSTWYVYRHGQEQKVDVVAKVLLGL